MKKKLNLYCMMFILAVGLGITIDFVTSFTDLKNGVEAGWQVGKEMGKTGETYEYMYENALVNFRPKVVLSLTEDAIGQDSIYNEITGEKEAIRYNSIVVYVPKEKSRSSAFSDTLYNIGGLLYMVGILGFWVIFFKVIRRVKGGDVFLHSVASYLTKAAIFILLAYAGEWVSTWAAYEHTREMVEIANYEIVPRFDYNNSNLYIAFGLLLLSQIIKYGKELKDEQDLTI